MDSFMDLVMENNIIIISGSVAIVLGALLFYYIFHLVSIIKMLDRRIREYERNLEEVDQQARLIVQTDLEMNEVQEEISQKMQSILALQDLSRLFNSSLNKESILSGFNPNIVKKIGFDVLVIVLRKDDIVSLEVKIGISGEAEKKLNSFLSKEMLLQTFKEQPSINSNIDYSNDKAERFKDFAKKTLSFEFFIANAFLIEGDVVGFVLLGNIYGRSSYEGKKEIADILVAQLSQSFENIKLFEELFETKQALEAKVKERTKELKQALDHLEKINKLKSEFVSSVSHEFRTPLTSIKGYASLLASGKFGDVSEEVRIRLLRIDQQADRLVGMINEMLDIARIESGRVRVEKENLNIVDTVKDAGENMIPQIRQKNITLEYDTPDNLMCKFDKDMISRVLTNLLSNAVKFTPEGGRIRILVSDAGDEIKASVKDSGMGIPQEDLENIFREFYRVESSQAKKIEGTGLGLSLVKNIIKAHGGQIWVESEEGKGANFIFVLPKE